RQAKGDCYPTSPVRKDRASTSAHSTNQRLPNYLPQTPLPCLKRSSSLLPQCVGGINSSRDIAAAWRMIQERTAHIISNAKPTHIDAQRPPEIMRCSALDTDLIQNASALT